MGKCLSKKDTTSNAAPKDKETRTATTNTPAGETVTAEQPKPQEATPAADANPTNTTEQSTEAAQPVATANSGSESAKMVKILVLYYSTYGHCRTMAEKVVEGVKAVEGVEVDLYQVPETLPEAVLTAMHAPPKADHPVFTHDLVNEKTGPTHIQLTSYDGIIFGFPTRYGMMCAQMKAFFDGTGGLWGKGALAGKMASIFFTTGTQGGGQETTALTAVTQLAHHGMIFVPMGYTYGPALFDTSVARGGSPYGAGALAGADGSRQPSEVELGYAEHHGKYFAGIVKKYVS